MSILKYMILIIVPILLYMVIGGCSALYKGPPSKHFDGSRFFNKEPDHTFLDLIKWMWEMETVEWPEWIEDPKQPTPVKRVNNEELRLTFINHATVLIQVGGLNILTDPVWSFRVGPVSWLGVKRVRKPGLSLDDLPGIDYVLISHDHYDHLDLKSLKQIAERHNPTILVGLGLRKFLSSYGILNVIELDWWQDYRPEGTDNMFTFVPAIHNSGRRPLMRNKTLWGGFVIDSLVGQIYYAGDTAFGDFLNSIGQRFKKIRLAILPIGSYEIRWFMKSQHMNPDDAVKAHIILGSRQSVGIHFGTFAEHPEQAIDAHEKDLDETLKKHNIPSTQFWVLKFGEGRAVPMPKTQEIREEVGSNITYHQNF